MKRSRFGRLIITVLAIVMVFAFTTTALAYSAYTTISSSSTTSQIRLNGISRDNIESWNVSGSSFYGSNSSVRLTVRPYGHNSSTRLSLAKTYYPAVQYGGQDYDVLANSIDVKANSSENGVWCGVTGNWSF